MIPAIDVRHDLRRLEIKLGLMPEERMAAAVRALNRTMTTVRKQAAQDMAAELPGLKIGLLKARMRFRRATRGLPSALLTFSNKRFRLFGNFSMRRSGLFGVRFGRLPWRLETGEGKPVTADTLRRAFLNRSRAYGTPNVFVRQGNDRYPIDVLVAPSLSEAFIERHIGIALVKVARDRFAVVFQQEAKFRLSRR